MTTGTGAAALGDRARVGVLRRRVRLIVAATITYNVVEAVVALAAGTAASSSALIAFGLDSVVEVLSAAAIAWQFAGGRNHENREHIALRLVAGSFFALAAVVTVKAVGALAGATEPGHSPVGITLAAVSLAIMPSFAWLEWRTGHELRSASVVADSRQVMMCAGLSAVLLGGLLANSLLGWSAADPIAALVIAALAVREGVGALRGDTCCPPASVLFVYDEADVSEACSGDAVCRDGTTGRVGVEGGRSGETAVAVLRWVPQLGRR